MARRARWDSQARETTRARAQVLEEVRETQAELPKMARSLEVERSGLQPNVWSGACVLVPMQGAAAAHKNLILFGFDASVIVGGMSCSV